MTLKSILTILFFIRLYHTYGLDMEPTSFTKILSHAINGSKIGFDWNVTSKNEILLNKIECARIGKSSICNFTQELYTFNEESNLLNNNSCIFEFGTKGATPLSSIRLSQLSEDIFIYDVTYAHLDDWHLLQFIFAGKVKSQRKLQIVDVKKCELINEIEVGIENTVDHLGDFLVRPDGSGLFDVFYTDSRLCHNTRAWVTYDQDGKLVDGPTCILDKIKGTEDFEKRMMEFKKFSNERFFLVDKNNEDCNGYLMNYAGDGMKKLFDTKCYTRGNSSNLRVSIDHERITYCHLQDFQKSVICSIYNVTSSKKISMTLTFPHNVSEFKVQNLADGGFLTLTSAHDEEKITKNETEDVQAIYQLRKFKSNGAQDGKTIEFQQCYEPATERAVAMEEIGTNRICFYSISIFTKICSEENCAPNFKFDVKCLMIDSKK